MRRPASAAFAAGICMSVAAELLSPDRGVSEAIRVEAGSKSTPVKEVVARKIVPHLGRSGLQVAALQPSEDSAYTDLIVTSGNGCGTSFSFSRDKVGLPGIEVHFNLFGLTHHLVDPETLHSSAMWNETIGHGDELARPTSFLPHEPKQVEAAVAYITQNHAIVCLPHSISHQS